MRISTWTALASLTAAACLSLACDAVPETTVSAASSSRPKVLRYSYAPGTEEPAAQELRLDQLKTYLERELHMPVELYKTTGGYGLVIEAMRARKVDVATLGPFGYLIASEKAGAQAILVTGSKGIGPRTYSGLIAVSRNSPIHSIDELLAQSRQLTFSFVDPASTSGFLVQRVYLQSRGIEDPDKAFKKTMFSMNHLASATTLIAGKVDAAAMMESALRTLMKRGKIKDDDIRILWKSPALPASPVTVRKDLPDDFKKEIQDAMLHMAERAPDLWKMWPNTSNVPDLAFFPANDAMFDDLRAMARNVKNLSLLEE